MQTPKGASIDRFQGFYAFLSNDYPTWVYYEGLLFPSVNTAYQAARASDIPTRESLTRVTSTQQFQRIAMSIRNPQGWAERKCSVMCLLVRDKFKRNKDILAKLQSTNEKQLINTLKKGGFNEQYWGVYEGTGLNMLGKILMQLRSQFNKGLDTAKWLQESIHLEQEEGMMAKVSLTVIREANTIDKIFADKGKPYYLFGSLKTVDFPLENPTISRNHACLAFTADLEVVIIDLNSTHGTFVKKPSQDKYQQLHPLVPEHLSSASLIKFGTSAREYLVDIDRASIEAFILESQNNLRMTGEEQKPLKDCDFDKMSESQVKKWLGMGKKYIYLEGVSPSETYPSIKEEFSRFGSVVNIRMDIDRTRGKFKGNALVQFENRLSIEEAIRRKKQIKFDFKVASEDYVEEIMREWQSSHQSRREDDQRREMKAIEQKTRRVHNQGKSATSGKNMMDKRSRQAGRPEKGYRGEGEEKQRQRSRSREKGSKR